tara:strand:- start:43752 stop:44213 length:462 start_codon:yes stop_codon:yes gene_type:complete
MVSPTQKTDLGFIAIMILVGVVVVWLLLTPLVPSVSLATMRRFHLGSESFTKWAMQFPIPAMYNFANQYEMRSLPPDLVDSILDPDKDGYLNHFSARVVTFADGRYHNLREGKDRWFVLRSDYRGRSLESHWHLKRVGEKHVVHRLDAQESVR